VRKPVKVRIVMTVTVDPDDWATTYGTDDVQADVRSYFRNHVQMAPCFDEVSGDVEFHEKGK